VIQMAVLKEVLSKYGKDFDTWLTTDQLSHVLSILRDSFLCADGNDAHQQREDILSVIESLAGSF